MLSLVVPVSVTIMSMDLYTQNITLTQKAKFWSNYISALKGKMSMQGLVSYRFSNRSGDSLCCRRG